MLQRCSARASTQFARTLRWHRPLSNASKPLVEYFKEPQHISDSQTTGLFGVPELVSPSSIIKFAENSRMKAQKMSDDIEFGKIKPEESIVRLDVLSDVICKVVDMVAFVRLAHPNRKMAEASQMAHELMFEFMNHLNTNQGLHQRVCDVLDNEHFRNKLNSEEIRVAEILRHDFEKSGIQFPAAQRQEFVHKSNVISVLSQQFLNEIGPAADSITFKNASDLDGLRPELLKQLTGFTGKVTLPLDGPIAELALQTVHSSKSRERIWRALRSASPVQVKRLETILGERNKLAQFSRYDSFAHYELTDKMMKTPENVKNFLVSLMKIVRPKAEAELAAMAPKNVSLSPWDHSYYYSKLSAAKRVHAKETAGVLATYFSLGDVFQGISDICEKLYNVRFEPGVVLNGEVWDPEVRRLDVYEGSEKIGVIYCDLFSRPGKSPNPAHFTIQCSRQIWPWEEPPTDQTYVQIKRGPDGEPEYHQLPVIALVCDFMVQNGRCLLSLSDVQTLFHEMGHAIHSMLGRTRLHNVGGTRCSTDFVELPSIMMEKFATVPEVLKLFARHHETGDPLPVELFRRNQLLNDSTENWETYHQIMLSLIDQALHGASAGESTFQPEAEVQAVQKEHGIFPDQQSQQYAQFGHLVSYGATYYSYLLDRCLANIIWEELFAKDPLSRESGEKFKNTILAWGGSKDAMECTRDVIGKKTYEEIAAYVV